MERGEGNQDYQGPVVRGVVADCEDLRRLEAMAGAVVPGMAMRMPERHPDCGGNGLPGCCRNNPILLERVRANYYWLQELHGRLMAVLIGLDWDEDVDHQRERAVRRDLAMVGRHLMATEWYFATQGVRPEDLVRPEVVPELVAVVEPEVPPMPAVPEEEPAEEEVPVVVEDLGEVPAAPVLADFHVEVVEEAPPPVVVPEVVPPPEVVVEAPPVVLPEPVVEAGEPAEEPEPVGAVAQREADRMEANRLHTPHRFKYAGVKRNVDHFNAEPDNAAYVPAPCIERTKHNFLWYFTKRRQPKYGEFADADLISFLRFHAFCVPRTPALIQTLKQRAIRFMADFDMAEHTMADIYRIVACSVAAAMIVTPEEELMRETIRSHSNMIEKYQPFFQGGQYRAGFLGYGVRSLV